MINKKNIVIFIANAVVDYSREISAICTVFTTYLLAKYWMTNDPVFAADKLLAIFLAVFIVSPATYLVCSIIMLMFKLLCFIYLFATRNFRSWDDYGPGPEYYSYKEDTYSGDKNRAGWQKFEDTYGSHFDSHGDGYQQSSRDNYVTEYSHALSYFGLKQGYTKEELKSKYRVLIKKAHPDVGGSTEAAAEINKYYEILQEYRCS